jgi:hypothetical protein
MARRPSVEADVVESILKIKIKGHMVSNISREHGLVIYPKLGKPK